MSRPGGLLPFVVSMPLPFVTVVEEDEMGVSWGGGTSRRFRCAKSIRNNFKGFTPASATNFSTLEPRRRFATGSNASGIFPDTINLLSNTARCASGLIPVPTLSAPALTPDDAANAGKEEEVAASYASRQ